MGGIGIWQLLIIVLIVLLLFGTRRLRSLGSDLGGALKGFRTAVKDDDDDTSKPAPGALEEPAAADGAFSPKTENASEAQAEKNG